MVSFLPPSMLSRRACIFLRELSSSSSFATTEHVLQKSSDSVTSELAPPSINTGSSKVASKQKISIKLRSYYKYLMDDAIKQVTEAARKTNAKPLSPVKLPTRKRTYSVLKSPFVHKNSGERFMMLIYVRLIEIRDATAQTVHYLMQLHLPAGVDAELKHTFFSSLKN